MAVDGQWAEGNLRTSGERRARLDAGQEPSDPCLGREWVGSPGNPTWTLPDSAPLDSLEGAWCEPGCPLTVHPVRARAAAEHRAVAAAAAIFSCASASSTITRPGRTRRDRDCCPPLTASGSVGMEGRLEGRLALPSTSKGPRAGQPRQSTHLPQGCVPKSGQGPFNPTRPSPQACPGADGAAAACLRRAIALLLCWVLCCFGRPCFFCPPWSVVTGGCHLLRAA